MNRNTVINHRVMINQPSSTRHELSNNQHLAINYSIHWIAQPRQVFTLKAKRIQHLTAAQKKMFRRPSEAPCLVSIACLFCRDSSPFCHRFSAASRPDFLNESSRGIWLSKWWSSLSEKCAHGAKSVGAQRRSQGFAQRDGPKRFLADDGGLQPGPDITVSDL